MFDFRKYETTDKFDEYLSRLGTKDVSKDYLLIDIGRSIEQTENLVISYYSEQDVEKALQKGIKLGLWEKLAEGSIRSIRGISSNKGKNRNTIPSNLPTFDFWNYETFEDYPEKFAKDGVEYDDNVAFLVESVKNQTDFQIRRWNKETLQSIFDIALKRKYIRRIEFDTDDMLEKIENSFISPEAKRIIKNYADITAGRQISEEDIDKDLSYITDQIKLSRVLQKDSLGSAIDPDNIELNKANELRKMLSRKLSYSDKIIALDLAINLQHEAGYVFEDSVSHDVGRLLGKLHYE